MNFSQKLNISLAKEEKRAEKIKLREAGERRIRRGRIFKKFGYWVLGLIVAVGSVWLLIRDNGPKGADYSQSILVLGREHIADGTVYSSYNSNPPTSGPHYPNPAPTGFYDKELRDERVVHNLEHGNVWISYKPGLSPDVIKVLRNFAGGNVIVTKRSANDLDVALAAWGRLDQFNIENGPIDERRIKDFIIRYQDRGPENLNIGLKLQ